MALEDFYADPEEFLKTNVVRVGSFPLKPGETKDSVFRFIIVHKIGKRVENPNGVDGDVYDLARGEEGVPGINAFFCPYKQDETHFITLTAAASYVFTPQMDGCTFGIGNESGGALIVGHANSAKIGKDWSRGYATSLDPTKRPAAPLDLDMARQRQRQAQMAILQNKMGWRGRFIAPEDYMPDNEARSTTFGVRAADGWKFYTACYWTSDSMTFQHRGVTTRFRGI